MGEINISMCANVFISMFIQEWYRGGKIGVRNGFYIWQSLFKVSRWLFDKMHWSFGRGDKILIGFDSILGFGPSQNLSIGLINALHARGIFS